MMCSLRKNDCKADVIGVIASISFLALQITPTTLLAESTIRVKISAVGTDERPVFGKVWRKYAADENWKAINATGTDKVVESVEQQCNDQVSYKFEATLYTHTPRFSEIQICSSPDVIFKGFTPKRRARNYALILKADAGDWVKAFGNDNKGTIKLAEDFRTATLRGQHGAITIMGTELATRLYNAGRYKEADDFRALALEAGVYGVWLKQRSINPGVVLPLALNPAENGPKLSYDAVTLIEKYQKNVLRYQAPTKTGRIDWKTMRSLSGGEVIEVGNWKLDKNDFSAFKSPAGRELELR